ncbi:hypothetical protein WJX75_002563 [Coccomyxa subellipsoidea]|uniref:Cystatin domain-containing protein n=1 Tax=Coccomyxa subellipsoidea TaxID=248742 RepID=A0ABR2YBD1_9CHLO
MRKAVCTVALLFVLGVSALAAPSPQTSPVQRHLGKAIFAPAPGPSFAALAPLQPVPYDSESKSNEVRPLPCRTETADGQGYMGSYKPVTAEDEKNGLANDFAPVAWQNFTQNQAITGCVTGSVHPVSFNVTEACKQLVAGTNYAFEFEVFFDCTSQQRSGSFGSVTLDAVMFSPLPIKGQNLSPQVSSVWNITEA